ncbi:MAG: PAS domain-containing protein [Chloroflexi bacterium]|nr:PAS domain-containing protein [Chloroflexota bacterium]
MPKNKPVRSSSSIRKRTAKPAESKGSSASSPVTASDSFPIIGVGASAGGLEAFTAFLNHLSPETGLAFVVVQHLDPKHSSILNELLAKETKMPVQEVKDGMKVRPNQVYVIPPSMDMTIRQGKLSLVKRTDARQQHMPIDQFFQSLAADQKANAIGVVLSGTGTDGTQGLHAIKMEGGLTFAQDFKSAKYDGMPRSAVAAGVVDFTLSPERIAGELIRLGNHPYITLAQAPEVEDVRFEGEDHLTHIFRMLHSATGVDFALYKPTTIKRRVARRMMLTKIDKLADYVQFIKNHPVELDELFQDLLISVTGFFREPATFDVLKKKVFPRLLKERFTQTPIRMWVPGCSTGEEVYSLAMCLVEYLGTRSHLSTQIFATDVSESAIEKARAGIYPESIEGEISPERLRRFFVKIDHGYQVSKTLRDMCVFARQDITRDPPFSRIDLISCRNLLIYLTQPIQKRIITTFHYALKPDGILVLGSSETIGSLGELFALLNQKEKIYYRKSAPARVDFIIREPTVTAHPIKLTPEAFNSFDIQREVDRILLNRYAPVGVFVDDYLDILQFRGQTGTYLEPASGAPSLNLLKMAREGLKQDLRAAIQEARKTNAPVKRSGVRFKSHNTVHVLNLTVLPIQFPTSKERHFLVLFEELPASRRFQAVQKPTAEKKARAARGSTNEHQLEQLQQQLVVTKEYLNATVEQLESTNEELRSALEEVQSSNEELQSTNEELETAKEELQSTNEELTTVNEELQNRNGELLTLNSDLVNLISGANIPIVLLTSDLRIRRFTAVAETVLNIISTDIGRPISDLRLNVSTPNLEEVARQVMKSLEPHQVETQDRSGHWYSVRIRPYRTIDSKIDGVMISWIDIAALKREGELMRSAQNLTRSVLDAVQDPVVVLDERRCITIANEAFRRLLNLTAEQSDQVNIFQLKDGAFDGATLRQTIEKDLSPTQHEANVQIELTWESHAQRFDVNARRLYTQGEDKPMTVLALKKITDGDG